MPDMLVNLYTLKENNEEKLLKDKGITVKRALIPDKNRILEFIKTTFSDGWEHECEYSLFNNPVSCYIAIKDKKIIGFACYDATAKGFFGPIGIKEDERHSGVGKVLLHKCLNSMKEVGYVYAVIGWAEDAIKFYEKTVGATIIPGSTPDKSIYQNLIHMN